MSKQEQTIDVPIGDQVFRIEKFTPDVGCYWAIQLLGEGLSLLSLKNSGKFNLQGIVDLVQKFIKMDRERFQALQKDSLAVVKVKFNAGFMPLMNDDGFFTLAESPSTPTILALTMHAFMFSMKDFFDPAQLEALGSLLPADFLAELKSGSENSETTPSQKDTGSSENSGTAPTP
jgi:hypothetical protein